MSERLDPNVLLVGGPGSGKSRALSEWAKAASESGRTVIHLNPSAGVHEVERLLSRHPAWATLVVIDGCHDVDEEMLRLLDELGFAFVATAFSEHGLPCRDLFDVVEVLG